MLLGLVFRGVAFEYRWRDTGHRKYWDFAFFAGSLVATLAQGITLGALLQGITVDGRAYGGGWWEWLSSFSLLTGASLVVAYAALGATFLIWKTQGPLHEYARRLASLLMPIFLLAVGAVSLATPFLEGKYHERWLDWPGVLLTAIMPLAFGGAALTAWHGIRRGADFLAFIATLAMFALTMAGLAVSIWPDVIPGRVTIWQAAAPHSSQLFMLVGAMVLVPIILAYTAWSYWVFRGKVGEEGYH
jgi:cytochrome d ubiquinol oxidase subunit II